MVEIQISVENNGSAQRYEALVDGFTSLIQYRLDGDQITFLHTKVPDALEGRGIGSALVRVALEDARVRHLTVVPRCPFVREYIRRHPEYESLVQSM
jgi:predicted GNAT family acetyltransferase